MGKIGRGLSTSKFFRLLTQFLPSPIHRDKSAVVYMGLSTVHGPGLPDSRDSQYPKFWEYWESRSPDSRDSQNPQNVEAIGSLGSLDSRTPNTLKIWDIGSLGSLGVWTPKTLNISGFGSPGVQSVDHCLMVTVLRSMGNWHKYSEKVSGKTNFCCWECSLSLFCHLSQREGCQKCEKVWSFTKPRNSPPPQFGIFFGEKIKCWCVFWPF